MASHAGAARFAYNAGLAHVKEALDNGESPEWSHPVGRMGLQCVARVRGVRCVCCVSPALSRMFALAILMVGGWVFLVSRPAWAIAALLALGWSRSDCSRARHASNTC